MNPYLEPLREAATRALGGEVDTVGWSEPRVCGKSPMGGEIACEVFKR